MPNAYAKCKTSFNKFGLRKLNGKWVTLSALDTYISATYESGSIIFACGSCFHSISRSPKLHS